MRVDGMEREGWPVSGALDFVWIELRLPDVSENHESANGQVRSFLESLLLQLCRAETGRDFDDAAAALQHLRNVSWLDTGEWNHFRSFWADIQDNGPHRGLSDPEEALFRFHFATAVARYLLTKRPTDVVS